MTTAGTTSTTGTFMTTGTPAPGMRIMWTTSRTGTRTPATMTTTTSTRNRDAKQQRPRCLPEGASCQLRE